MRKIYIVRLEVIDVKIDYYVSVDNFAFMNNSCIVMKVHLIIYFHTTL